MGKHNSRTGIDGLSPVCPNPDLVIFEVCIEVCMGCGFWFYTMDMICSIWVVLVSVACICCNYFVVWSKTSLELVSMGHLLYVQNLF